MKFAIFASIVAVLVLLFVLNIFLLVPIPLLTYRKGKRTILYGEVLTIKRSVLGVTEVALIRLPPIPPTVEKLGIDIHLRRWKPLFAVGDRLEVTIQEWSYRLTARTFNWLASTPTKIKNVAEWN